MKKVVKKSISFHGRELVLETGTLAPQANASVLARYGDTVVLVAVSTAPNEQVGDGGFPLRVDFEERLYAGGVIKNSRFMKREGRPSDESILGSRLIDRSIRPFFPKEFKDQVQLIATTLSVDNENDPQLLSLIGASAALSISTIPWKGPLAAIYVGLTDGGEFEINPANLESKEVPTLKLLVTASQERVVMLEAQAREVADEKVKQGIIFALEEIKPVLELITEFAKEVNPTKMELPSLETPAIAVQMDVTEKIKAYLASNYEDDSVFETIIRDEIKRLQASSSDSATIDPMVVRQICAETRKKLIREMIIASNKRVDGRGLDEIRDLTLKVSMLPRTHGSALFQRGQTQVLSVVTLGSASLEQLIEGMEGESTKRYLHHYNAPAYSIGGVGPNRGPGRREIGHGALAEKALFPVIPERDVFPYTVRVVSEVLSQNGSSSMASTCGSSLSLMDAGVPIKSHVAGISIGLVEDGAKFKLLTDIRGLEDFCGDMDFKVAGTTTGITAIQLDVKNTGLTKEIIEQTIDQAKAARERLLKLMTDTIAIPRTQLSEYAPKVAIVYIDPAKIGEVIGSGGKVIKSLMQQTGTEISVDDDGSVVISGTESESIAKAKAMVEAIVLVPEVGEVYHGKVSRILDFGAFVEIAPGKEGLVHISQIAYDRVNRVEDILNVGDEVDVKVIEIDSMGRVNLSIKALLEKPEGYEEPPREDRPPRFSGGGNRRFQRGSRPRRPY